MAEKRADRRNTSWSESELRIAIDAYLYMLQLQVAGIRFSVVEQERLLFSGPLSNRNDASIRYRMRNVSCIMEERGDGVLKAYSPAPQVGKNVKARLHAILDERADTLDTIRRFGGERRSDPARLNEVLISLERLKGMVSELSAAPTSAPGIGHNNPPEAIDIRREELSEVSRAITDIEEAISGDNPDLKRISVRSDVLVRFGLKCALWAGERMTDFAKAGAIAAGTGAGLSLSGIGGQIVETLQNVFSYLH